MKRHRHSCNFRLGHCRSTVPHPLRILSVGTTHSVFSVFRGLWDPGSQGTLRSLPLAYHVGDGEAWGPLVAFPAPYVTVRCGLSNLG